jgi:uncharacterized protein (TIGR03089 family)
MMTYWDLLKAVVNKNSARPFYTWISDVGRIELSGATFINAVSKANNFLTDGLELELPTKIDIQLGNHWQSPVWRGTALSLGFTIADQDSDLTIGVKSQAQTWQGSSDEFVVISQDPFGMPDKDIPVGFVNGSAEVRNFGDHFSLVWPIPADHAAIEFEFTNFTWDDLVIRATELAEKHGIKSGHSFGIHGTSDLLTLTALQVVLPATNENPVVLIDQTNPNFESIKKHEKLEQIVMLG